MPKDSHPADRQAAPQYLSDIKKTELDPPGRPRPERIPRHAINKLKGSELGGGDGGEVGAGLQPHGVQDRRPGRAAVLGAAAAVGVAERAVQAGRRVRPQPRGGVHREHQAAVGGTRQRQAGQCGPQPLDVHAVPVQRAVRSAVPMPVLGRQRQVDQRLHRPVAAQQRVGRLEQSVAPPGQAVVEDPTEA